MRYFWHTFLLMLRARLHSPRFWAALFLLPLLTLAALHLLPVQEVSAPVQVGVVLPQNGDGDFWQCLERRSGTVVSFIQTDKETLLRRVASSQWDCGIVLDDDFEQKLRELDTDRLFTLYIGPGSTVYPLVRETVSACLGELVTAGIAADYLQDAGILAPQEDLQEELEGLLPDVDGVSVTMETLGGRTLNPLTLAGDSISAILRGLIAVVLLVWMLFAAMDLGRWLSSPAALRMRTLRGTVCLLLPRITLTGLTAFCSGALSLLVLKQAASIPALIPYLLCLGALALLLARFRGAWGALPMLMPFVPAVCLLLSPILLDITLLLPQLAPLCTCVPTTLYLRACTGDMTAVLLLLGAALILSCVPLLTDRKKM